MMTFDYDKFLPPFVKLSTSPCCTYFSSQVAGRSQLTRLSTVNVHNARLIDSAHFAQPMSDNSTCTYRSPSLVHLCNDSPASSTCIVSYIGRQYARTVPNVDIVGSRNVIPEI
jgi:hypothetical protein